MRWTESIKDNRLNQINYIKWNENNWRSQTQHNIKSIAAFLKPIASKVQVNMLFIHIQFTLIDDDVNLYNELTCKRLWVEPLNDWIEWLFLEWVRLWLRLIWISWDKALLVCANHCRPMRWRKRETVVQTGCRIGDSRSKWPRMHELKKIESFEFFCSCIRGHRRPPRSYSLGTSDHQAGVNVSVTDDRGPALRVGTRGPGIHEFHTHSTYTLENVQTNAWNNVENIQILAACPEQDSHFIKYDNEMYRIFDSSTDICCTMCNGGRCLPFSTIPNCSHRLPVYIAMSV